MDSENPQDLLMAAQVGQTVIVRVQGRGSFKISPALKQFIHHLAKEGSAQLILLDMSDCVGMDSTFMGMLAGTSAFLKREKKITLKLINLSQKNKNLLSTLGVDRVLEHHMDATEEEQALLAKISDKSEQLDAHADKLEAAQTALEAHQSLAEIDPENQIRFRSVLELLQNDVQTLTSP